MIDWTNEHNRAEGRSWHKYFNRSYRQVCAIALNVVCLVSNDKHFQILKTIDFPKVKVLELQEFEEK